MGEQGQSPTPHAGRRRVLSGALQLASVLLGAAWLAPTRSARAIGPSDAVDVRRVSSRAGPSDPHPRAAQRLAWEVRKRTSIETQLDPSTTTFDDPSIYRTPLLYWAGDRAFPELSDKELTGLRRFVEYGGMLVIDDASPEVSGFDASVRRALGRAFPGERLTRLSNEHTIFRSFYLLDGPAGRVAAPDYVEGIVLGGRAAVVYSRHDLGGAWSADDGRDTSFVVVPGGSAQREQAVRLGVNLVMYALCLDYKDDQVHAPFLLRRRAGRP
jgi:Domain of unknown function (DUF4159)